MTEQDIDICIGKRLRLRRTMMGMSQETVAKAVGITFQQVQKYEKGTNAMNAHRLVKFARFMNVPVAYFFDELEHNVATDKHETGDFTESPENFSPNIPSDRESLEIMKAFKRIDEQSMRKRLSDLVRAIAAGKVVLG